MYPLMEYEDMKSRKEYAKKVYYKHWIKARKTVYVNMPYDKAFVDLIDNIALSNYNNMLEVCIGTGQPIASALVEKGYSIYGIDISKDLVDICTKGNPQITCKICDAECLDYNEYEFDLTYCVHSSWYIPDFNKALSEMIRVVKISGNITFDIINITNTTVHKIYKRHIYENTNPLGMLYKGLKNAVKLIVRRGTVEWPYIVTVTPLNPQLIYETLKINKVKHLRLLAWENSLIELDINSDDLTKYERLVFTCEK
jgi:SAM-dependent methyltransferase